MKLNRIEQAIYDTVGTDYWGDGRSGPPGDGWGIDYGEESDGRPMYLARWNNDGYELWLGFPHEWLHHMCRSDARRLAVHILWCDVRLWFGLRRWVWYRLLRKQVKR